MRRAEPHGTSAAFEVVSPTSPAARWTLARGYEEVERFNDELYSHHGLEKRLEVR